MEKVDQKDLWQDDDNPQFAELCNALYERELKSLASSSLDDIEFLKSRLGSVPYYVKRTAEHMLFTNSPLDIDTQNGTWQYRQPTQSPHTKVSAEDTADWLQQHAELGLVMPVWQLWMGEQTILLDSIDRIDTAQKRVRLNEHGWFYFHGQEQSSLPQLQKILLKPGKAVMACACSGHRWNVKGRVSPRTLSLRELLLSSVINWRNFYRQQMPNRKI